MMHLKYIIIVCYITLCACSTNTERKNEKKCSKTIDKTFADIENPTPLKMEFKQVELKYEVTTYMNEQVVSIINTVFILDIENQVVKKIFVNNDSTNVENDLNPELKNTLQKHANNKAINVKSFTLGCGTGCAMVYELYDKKFISLRQK